MLPIDFSIKDEKTTLAPLYSAFSVLALKPCWIGYAFQGSPHSSSFIKGLHTFSIVFFFTPHPKMHSLTSNVYFPPFLQRKSFDAGIVLIEPPAIQVKSRKGHLKNPIFFTTLNCIRSPDKPISRSSCIPKSCLTITETQFESLTVAEKVHCLACEFKSLSEPIDRVKRLLHYATLLPPFDESARVQENRVMGCTTMVWLKVEMGSDNLMRYKVDSDSEITKGFCSCLIWLFDGAVPEEVLSVKTDDLMEMNVGMPSKGHSRVNTWHNILSSMQKKTQNFVEVRDKDRSLIDFHPFGWKP